MHVHLSGLLGDDDVRHVVGRWMVGVAEVVLDGLQPVQRRRCPHPRVVEHGIGQEQPVEAIPLLGVDDVPVLVEELVDLDQVQGVHGRVAVNRGSGWARTRPRGRR